MHPIRADRIIVPLLRQVVGEAARRKGNQTEESIMHAFEVAHVETPVWFRGIVHAPQKLDLEQGIDFVIASDIGDLYLQIKSSNLMANKFRCKQGRKAKPCQRRGRYSRHIAVVSTEGAATPEEICKRVFHAVGRKREKLLVERGQTAAA